MRSTPLFRAPPPSSRIFEILQQPCTMCQNYADATPGVSASWGSGRGCGGYRHNASRTFWWFTLFDRVKHTQTSPPPCPKPSAERGRIPAAKELRTAAISRREMHTTVSIECICTHPSTLGQNCIKYRKSPPASAALPLAEHTGDKKKNEHHHQ